MIRWFLALALFFALSTATWARSGDQRVTWAGAVELPDGSKLEFSVELAKDSGTITIPAQGVQGLQLSDVTVTDKQLKFAIKDAGAAWALQIADDGKTATGVLKQGGEFKTTLKRLAAGESAPSTLVRPQEPKPPFPYDVLEVTFDNAPAKATFAGTLTLPKGNGPFPCVVMVTGSGPQDRDEALLGHRPFLVIADHLTRHGIAVLRYDDRGVGKSTGTFAGATSDDFAEDALAAVAFLKTRKEIDGRKIGIAGHSEGGLIAPMCAAKSKDVAFIVLLAGTGISGAELMPIQTRLISIAAGMSAAEADAQSKAMTEIFGMVAAGKSETEVKARIRELALDELAKDPKNKDVPREKLLAQADQMTKEQAGELFTPWFLRFLAIDPRKNLEKVTCPVLAVNGAKDLQVPSKENLPQIEKALKGAGNKDVTIVEFPDLNHLFQTCKTGSPSEYSTIEETFAPIALETVTSWIRKRAGLE